MQTLVVGLGRVGLPHALLSAKKGNNVIGYDKNLNLIHGLISKKLPFIEKGMDKLLQSTLNKTFYPKTELNQSDWNQIKIVIVTIGVDPFNGGSAFDNFWKIISYFCQIGVSGKTIVFRTTLPVGTIDKVRDFIISKTGLKSEVDFFLVFWPERIVEGVALKEELTLPRIVGAYSEKGFKNVSRYIKTISNAPITRVSNPRTAEFIKLLDNSYRATMFAFSNDVAIAAENVGVNIFEALNAANSNYPRNNIKNPSIGIGGYCLTKDPYFLELSFPDISREQKHSVWWYSRKISDEMPNYIASKISYLLNQYNLNKVLILGITYKEDADDTRLSPSLDLAKSLSNKFNVSIYDPYIGKSDYVNVDGIDSEIDLNNVIKGKECVIVAVKHKQFLDKIKMLKLIKNLHKPAIIVDIWGIMPWLKGKKNIIYWGFGL